MKQIAFTLFVAALMAGCVSSQNRGASDQPNYVQAQLYQSPMPRGAPIGTDDMIPEIGAPE